MEPKHMHRFFLPGDCLAGDKVTIPASLSHRLRRVLRLGAGDRIIILDNSGWEYDVELSKIGGSGLGGVVLSRAAAAGEPRTNIMLYQALLKGRGFELVLQKCTEVGVVSFVPVICERCLPGDPASSRLKRWRSIILEAAQQSRRGRLPVLHDIMSFDDACRSASEVTLLPWEGEATRGIGDVLRDLPGKESARSISIFIGPEGGFSDGEVEIARGCGITPVSLGRRIVRAETAGVVASAVTLYEFGEFDVGAEEKGLKPEQ